jgi:type IV pilus assembly protein PilA
MTRDDVTMQNNRGFTLTEMVVVIAIIAILAMISLPSYLERNIRLQIEAAMPLAEIAKKPVVAAWTAQAPFPLDNTAAGLPAADKIVNNYVSAVAIQDGAISITFGNQAVGAIKGKILTLRPAVVADAPVVPVTWVCGNANPPDKMTVKGDNRTSVPANYLPLECRLRN